MSNVKITQLPLATTPLTGTEVFPLVQGTTTKQVSITGLFTSPVMTNPTLGTVGQADLINATGLPISTGVAGLGTGIATFLGTPSSANLRAAVTDETGTGSLVFANSPTLVTPNLGTPSAMVATNITGTALGLIAGSAVTNANLTGAVTSIGNATSLGSFTSAQLATALTDETGSGVAVFATSPVLVTPNLGTPSAAVLTNATGLPLTTGVTGTLGLGNGGTGQTTANAAFNALAPSQTGNSGKYLTTDGTNTSWATNPLGTVTSVGGTGTVSGISLSGTVTTSGNLTLGGALNLSAYNGAGAFTTLSASGIVTFQSSTNPNSRNFATKNLIYNEGAAGNIGFEFKNLTSGNLQYFTVESGDVMSFGAQGGQRFAFSGGTKLETTSGGVSVTGTLGVSGAITNTAGTANGVTYLNGSKVLTSGSALTFDGTNLNIGTATSATNRLLNVQGSTVAKPVLVQTTTTNALIEFNDSSTASKPAMGSVGDALTFWPAGTEGMRLTSTGLGIGTSSPGAKLDVNGNVQIKSGGYELFLNSDNTNYYYLQNTGATGSANPKFEFVQGGVGTRLTLDSAGNLGLGVTPSAWGSGGNLVLPGSGTLQFAGAAGNVVSNAYFNASWKYATTAAATYYAQTSGQHQWYTAPSGTAGTNITFTQAMTLDASGNLIGGGKTSASLTNTGFELTADGALRSTKSSTSTNLATSNGGSLQLTNSSATDGNFSNIGGYNSNGLVVSQIDFINVSHASRTGDIAFLTHNGTSLTERARIDSSGSLLVGTTSTGLKTNRSMGFQVTGGCTQFISHSTSDASGDSYVEFGYNGTKIGSITQSGTTAVLYNVTSDQRLKENIQDADSASSLIDSLQVRQFDWKTDGNHQRYGFVAQELVTVAPEAVHQPADTEEMMAVDYSKLVPMLVKEIQSLRQRVAQLETN